MKEPLIIDTTDLHNQNEKQNKPSDIFTRANCFSKLFLYWPWKLLRQARISPLKNENMGKLEGKNKSENFMKKIFQSWDTAYKQRKNKGLLSMTFKSNICKLLK
jgi:hypothetical protein